jgi:hypothetical protein
MQTLITVTEQNGTVGLQTVASGTRLHSRPATRCQTPRSGTLKRYSKALSMNIE